MKFLLAFVFTIAVSTTMGFFVSEMEWDSYKLKHGKMYNSALVEYNARFNYIVNNIKMNWDNGRLPYKLGENQFSDMTFKEFVALFKPTVKISSNGIPYTHSTVAPPASFSYPALGFTSPIQNQGQICNSGWAYSSASALQIFKSIIAGNLVPSQPLSAQNFIDCAGSSRACYNQDPQAAFDYLTVDMQKLYPLTDYPINPFGQGPCIPPSTSTGAVSLTSYSNIPDGNDAALMSAVVNISPVVVEFNPASFEFMHYKEGIFTQPKVTQRASHFMLVIGYGTEAATNRDYWILQNSFGTTWGEAGLIRIERNSLKSIAKSAIFPFA